jgi:menaquinone-dependent protoporphyrinogen IX oxidase
LPKTRTFDSSAKFACWFCKAKLNPGKEKNRISETKQAKKVLKKFLKKTSIQTPAQKNYSSKNITYKKHVFPQKILLIKNMSYSE